MQMTRVSSCPFFYQRRLRLTHIHGEMINIKSYKLLHPFITPYKASQAVPTASASNFRAAQQSPATPAHTADLLAATSSYRSTFPMCQTHHVNVMMVSPWMMRCRPHRQGSDTLPSPDSAMLGSAMTLPVLIFHSRTENLVERAVCTLVLRYSLQNSLAAAAAVASSAVGCREGLGWPGLSRPLVRLQRVR